MGILFISHSGRDNAAALKVRDWLRDRGWNEVFLDLDPHQGLAPGHRWQQELKQAGERCSGVVVLLSPNWLGSRWCQTEFLLADQLGKRIFPILIAPTPFDDLPIGLRGKFQIVDVSAGEKETDGFYRLEIGLKRAGLNPKSFEWPPPGELHRSIYRGLQSLEEQDAAIFFGRDAAITRGLDALRRIRDGAPERLLVILGASGAGKSSFLQAGLIARLRRDEENFVVLPVIRPEDASLTGERGLAASLSYARGRLNGKDDILAAFAECRERATARLRRFAECAGENYLPMSPTVVIPIDQAEELFVAENTESALMMEWLSAAVIEDSNAVVLATIRSDSFERLQSESHFAQLPVLPFSLAAIPRGAFKDVIECPARLANPPMTIDPALTERLLEDLAADDALPLLAFTLERLLSRNPHANALTLDHYMRQLGGLRGAISAAIESAFAAAANDPCLPDDRAGIERLARAAFIPSLVQIEDAESEPRRRTERLDLLPKLAHPLLRHLINERLLVTDRRLIDGVLTDVVEVAHEAILRQWPALRAWIAEERESLRAFDGLRASAAEWRRRTRLGEKDGGQSWLLHRSARLEQAEALATRKDFASALGEREHGYLAACRAVETNELTRERRIIARTRRLQRNLGLIIALAAILVFSAGAGLIQLFAGLATRSSQTLTSLAAAEADKGYYDRAARYALAGIAAGNWPLARGNDAEARAELWGAANLSSTLAVLRGHRSLVLTASFSPDGKRILTASQDTTAAIWDSTTGRRIALLRGHHREILGAAFSPDGKHVVTASADGTARLWDTDAARQLRIFRGHSGAVVSAAFSPDGKRLVTASRDDTARLWEVSTGKLLAVLRGHGDQLESAAFSPDGTRIVTASDDRTARIWDATTARTISILKGHQGIVASAAFSPDGKRIVTASYDRTAAIWDAMLGTEIAVLKGHDDAVTSAAYDRAGSRIVTASFDRTARLWDAHSGRLIAILKGHEGAVNSASFSRDGARIVTASDDRTARIWDSSLAARAIFLRGHEDSVNSAVFSHHGTRVVTASTDKTARLWDASSGNQLRIFRGHLDLVESAAFSPDDARVVTASDDGTARIWDARSGGTILVLRGHEDRVNSATYDPSGTHIVTASADGTARVWDARTGHLLSVLRGHARGLNGAVFSPDGRHVATASGDGTARIWDVATGRALLILRGHASSVSSVDFDRSGTRLATAGHDGTTRIWDAATGRVLAVLRGHEGSVFSAEFSPDGTRVLTASQDKTVQLWNAQTGNEIAVLRGEKSEVTDADFSPDGRRIVTAASDGEAREWNVSPAIVKRTGLVARVCKIMLAHGLSRFSADELRAAPVLDPMLDSDACHPPGRSVRLADVLWADVSP
ncbi:MAG TPA: TIR domain-containing protein [Rhizomicrobium sp.]